MYDIGSVWKDWKIVRLIGEGSFGKVYEIERNQFGIEEHSAMKVVKIPNSTAEVQSLKSEGMDQGSLKEYYMGLVEDFSQEIALMIKLKSNPGIVECEDYTVIEHKNDFGWDIIIRMELLTPLSKVIASRELTEDEVIDLGISLCDALTVCHKNKIIHRDIKIDNIFVTDTGFYKLGDFGVARTIDKTAAGLSKKGTYTYMAPEVYRGEEYGHKADIYSLGMVMYRLLNHNREPFLPKPPANVKYSDKNNALIRRMSGERFEPPSNASSALAQVIMKACEYKANDRYLNASDFKQAILQVKSGQGISGNAAQTAVGVQTGNPTQYADSYGVNKFPGQPYDRVPDYNNGGLGNNNGRQYSNVIPNTYESNPWNSGGPYGPYKDDHNYMGQYQNFQGNTKPKNKNSTVAILLGWLGVLLEVLGIVVTKANQWVKPQVLLVIIIVAMLITAVMMVIFTFGKKVKAAWVIMIISSVLSLSIVNIIASFMFYNDVFYNQNRR